jgi:hypothetical protein
MIANRRRRGTTSGKSSSRFPAVSAAWSDDPVTLPAGRERLVTRPAPSGSTAIAKTMGVVGIGTDPFLVSRRDQLWRSAARYALPAIYPQRELVAAGGLISHGPHFADVYRQAGVYGGRVLAGAKPADLPVMQPTKFELVINLRTAKALGLDVPPTLLATAGVIELQRGSACCGAAMSPSGQKTTLPRRSIAVRFTPISRRQQDPLNAMLCANSRPEQVQQPARPKLFDHLVG